MEPDIDKLVILLSRGIAQRRLYFADHPKMRACGQDFVHHLEKFLTARCQDTVFVGVVDGKLVHEGRYLVGPSIAGGQLVRCAMDLRCGGFTFRKTTTATEILDFFSLAAELTEPVADTDVGRQLLRMRGIAGIVAADPYRKDSAAEAIVEGDTWEGTQGDDPTAPSPILIYQALFDVVSGAHGRAALGDTLDIDGARSVSELLVSTNRSQFTDIMQLMAYPDFDTYTVGHSVRVATLAVYVGTKMGLADAELLELGTAALLHDVGKSQIPDEILFKRGRLEEDEYRVMKTHAMLGAEILLEHKNVTPMGVAAAWGHHIRNDGGGYPENPPWAVRNAVTALLQVCDVFEALTAIRPYKAPMSPWTAYETMLADRGAFHPSLLTTFVRALGLYPPGQRVRLSDGSIGTVIAAGSRIDRPRVRVTGSGHGRAEPRVINLDTDDAADLAVCELIAGDPRSSA